MELSEVHDFWRNKVSPAGYLKADARRGVALTEIISHTAIPDPTILELGCNAGRNLATLWRAGFRHLTGVEISPEATHQLHMAYPYLQARIITAPIESCIRDLQPFDIVFTMAVLLHIHPDSEWIFAEMVRLTRRCLIVVENENSLPYGRVGPAHHFMRNYKEVFEALGMSQRAELIGFPGLPKYNCRVFAPKAAA